jgi:hypothetical protein
MITLAAFLLGPAALLVLAVLALRWLGRSRLVRRAWRPDIADSLWAADREQARR